MPLHQGFAAPGASAPNVERAVLTAAASRVRASRPFPSPELPA